MRHVTGGLGLALAGAILQLGSLGSDFYQAEGEQKDAWLGIPHTSDLILLSALVTVALIALTAAGRSPMRGGRVGIAVGIVGLLATLQLGYRMLAPPFGAETTASGLTASCLYYCAPSEAKPAELLLGIWVAFGACLAVTLGGLAAALSPRARQAPARPWRSAVQGGMSPWLGLAALGAAGQFVFGYTFFTFYTSSGPARQWSGWLPTPHTSSLVLAITAVVIVLVWAAATDRAPLTPAALGVLIAVLGFVASYRILFRIVEPPFSRPAEVGVAAFVSLAAALVVLVSGALHALTHREVPAARRAAGEQA